MYAAKFSHIGANFAFLPFYWISYSGLFQLDESHVCLQKYFLVIVYKVGLCSVTYTSKGRRGNRKGIYKATLEEAGVPLMIMQNSLIILRPLSCLAYLASIKMYL